MYKEWLIECIFWTIFAFTLCSIIFSLANYLKS